MFLSVVRSVQKIRRDFDFDIIDSHYIYPDGFAAVLLGRLLGKPVVVSARGSDINLFTRFSLIRKLLRFTLLRADHVIAVSAALREVIARLGIPRGKMSVIPNGVDGGKFKRVSKQEARRILGLPANRPMLLSVGGLTEVKGFDRLLEAFKVVFDDSRGIKPRLTIIGEGSWWKRLDTMASEMGLSSHVHFVGAVRHEQLYLWYNAADVFCLTSKREGWPNVILESLVCGLPVVAAAVGGVPEILVNEDIGLLTPREPAIIASRIKQAIQKQWDPDTISRYAAGFSWNAAAARVRNVFDSVSRQCESRRSSCRSVGEERSL
jgi:glycosyltransferase involved in cell wall biosynthesis